ncbi:Transcriptional regulator protein (fragment) [Rhizobium mesoamericanum STM3625]|uniref:Transcriptional regulator protein n=1 Tax=Rhizobium mesoamericanum STM3625 TaxID=1211777 RepID=K0Q1X9_9HYPH
MAARKRIPLIGLCTGPFVLAEAGLLGRHETCVSLLHCDAFREGYPHLKVRPDRLFNFGGNFGSCAGGASVADSAASIVRSKLGREAEQNALDIRKREFLHTF